MNVHTSIPNGNPGPRGTTGRIWIEPDPLPEGGALFHADPLLHAILSRRLNDPAEAVEFLDDQRAATPDPDLLPGLPEAVARVAAAIRRGESIGVFGDYDTDGVTSAAILTLAIGAASAGQQPLSVRLPRRSEGYGLSRTGVDDLAAAGARLLIAVDCGSRDHEAVAHARERGLEVIILDHHRLMEDPPHGAIIASAQLQADGPYHGVSAAGIAYLFAVALARQGFDTGNGVGQPPESLLDLTMIGLVGDVCPLVGVTRRLVRDGLRQLRQVPRPGLQALCASAGIERGSLTSSDVAFMISPRLNAPGRLGDPWPAFELLVAESQHEAEQFARIAEISNRQRRDLLDRVVSEIETQLAVDQRRLERRVLLFAGEGWEPGIVGLAASKLSERYDRPVVVMALVDGEARGSARSIAGFDVTAALTDLATLLTRHGGHERAAGLSVPIANLSDLDDALQEAIARTDAPTPGPGRLRIDAELPEDRLTVRDARTLQLLEPFGEGNPQPTLKFSRLPVRSYTTMGREQQHLKIQLGRGFSQVDAVLWNGASRSRELLDTRYIDIAGSLETNVWNGNERAQIRIADFRLASG